MMILHSSPASPFGRKVKTAIALLGLTERVEIRTANVNDPADPNFASNPLGKIPTLSLEDGTALFDSRVILEYLDHLAGGGRILPADAEARFPALALQAAADGLLDAAILQVYERRYRPEEMVHQPWLDRQAEKVTRTLRAWEAAPPALSDGPNVGTLTLACALEYLDFRFAGVWRADYPKLVAWLAQFNAATPAFANTRPQD